jgi:hypothetical protein
MRELCLHCGNEREAFAPVCEHCGKPRVRADPKVAAPPARPAPVRAPAVVKHRRFESGTDPGQLPDQVAAFCTEVGRENLIGISQSNAAFIVWYWSA